MVGPGSLFRLRSLPHGSSVPLDGRAFLSLQTGLFPLSAPPRAVWDF